MPAQSDRTRGLLPTLFVLRFRVVREQVRQLKDQLFQQSVQIAVFSARIALFFKHRL